MEKARNYLISDVELNWARLDNPIDNPFGEGKLWEVQVATSSSEKADELKAAGFNVKEKDGMFTVSLRRNATRRDGAANEPVRLVDAQKQPIAARNSIGNGSKANVIVYQLPYTNKFGTGVSNILSAVQVTDLVEFTPSGMDFDIVGEADESTQTAMF